MKNIAFFITPHGFGHAARAAGVMGSIRVIDPSVRFEIFTTVPKVFFDNSAGADFGYHAVLTDVGLIQDSPTRENLPETLKALQRMLPFDQQLIAKLANTISHLHCQLVVCDIAPLGIAVAREAGIPSVLVENFRWDWIYQHYLKSNDQFSEYINYLQDVFNSADHLIQAEPVCLRHEADLRTLPICRSVHTPATEVRTQLGLTPEHKAIYVSMGGSSWDPGFLRDLPNHDEYFFIISSGNASAHRQDNLLFLNVHTYMPDILAASDVVISKLGYSTLAEVYYAGIPFGYLTRPHFPESPILQNFVHAKMQGMHIPESQFYSGAFVDQLDELLSLPRIQRDHASTGADAAARFILDLLPGIAT